MTFKLISLITIVTLVLISCFRSEEGENSTTILKQTINSTDSAAIKRDFVYQVDLGSITPNNKSLPFCHAGVGHAIVKQIHTSQQPTVTFYFSPILAHLNDRRLVKKRLCPSSGLGFQLGNQPILYKTTLSMFVSHIVKESDSLKRDLHLSSLLNQTFNVLDLADIRKEVGGKTCSSDRGTVQLDKLSAGNAYFRFTPLSQKSTCPFYSTAYVVPIEQLQMAIQKTRLQATTTGVFPRDPVADKLGYYQIYRLGWLSNAKQTVNNCKAKAGEIRINKYSTRSINYHFVPPKREHHQFMCQTGEYSSNPMEIYTAIHAGAIYQAVFDLLPKRLASMKDTFLNLERDYLTKADNTKESNLDYIVKETVVPAYALEAKSKNSFRNWVFDCTLTPQGQLTLINSELMKDLSVYHYRSAQAGINECESNTLVVLSAKQTSIPTDTDK